MSKFTKKINILAITGIRSEYDILFPIIKALDSDESYNVKLLVSGAHLSENQGYTYKKIVEDGFKICDRIHTLLDTDSISQRSLAVSMLISGLNNAILREKPDVILVVGDREESIAAAIVGNYSSTLVAHIGGGDPVWGNSDDPIRMAVSKLSHIHLTTSKKYADNLISLGEDIWRICNIGTPGLDNIMNEPPMTLTEVNNGLGISLAKYIVFIKHPLSSELIDAPKQMRISLDAIQGYCTKHNFKCVWIKSNGDPGSVKMSKTFEQEKYDKIHPMNSLPRNLFVNLMRHSYALVGNSSMGILEAPTYKIPVVNIGNRQQGRMNAGNVKFTKYSKIEIIKAIENACLNNAYRDEINRIVSPYGDGNSSIKFLNFFKKLDFDDNKWKIKACLVK